MTANVGLAPVVAVLLVGLAGASIIVAEAREETSCLAAPGAQAPAGRHWFYRIDKSKQRKCWYLRAQSAAEATAKAPMRHRLRIASTAPEARSPSPSEQLLPEIRLEPHADEPVAAAPDERTIPPSVNDSVQAPRKADADIAAGSPVPAPVVSDANVVLSPRPSDDRVGRASQSAAERIRQAHTVSAAAAQPDAHAREDADGGDEVTQSAPAPASGHIASLAFVFAGAILVLAGIFLHPIVQVFARRPAFQAGGPATISRTSVAREWKTPGFLARWREARLHRREYHLDEI